MLKQEVRFAVTMKNGAITGIEKSCIFQPGIKPAKGGIKWYDDSKLLKGAGGQDIGSPDYNSFRKGSSQNEQKQAN